MESVAIEVGAVLQFKCERRTAMQMRGLVSTSRFSAPTFRETIAIQFQKMGD